MVNEKSLNWETRTVAIGELTPYEKNPRTITPKAYKQLVDSLRQDGYHQRIIATRDLRVIGGHQRIKALQEIGLTEIEILIPDRDITDEQFKRILVRDNIGFGEWDLDSLGELMSVGELIELGVQEDLFPKTKRTGLTDDDEIPPPPAEPEARPGDIWLLGEHRVMCGDSTKLEDVLLLMGGEQADMIWTDPPYNVAYTGKTKDALTIENDQMGDADFYQFLLAVHCNMRAVTKPGGAIYVAHADSEGMNFRKALLDAGFLLKQCLIWVKQSFVMGRQDYHWQHEPILYGWAPGASHAWYSDRKQTTVLNFDRPQRNAEHPTMKPVALVEYMLKNSSKEGDVVLDLFGGSGTTLIASVAIGRRARLMELDPKYVDVIVKRWEDYTGLKAVLQREARAA